MSETIDALRIKKMRACDCLIDRTQATRRMKAYMYMSACLRPLIVRELFSLLLFDGELWSIRLAGGRRGHQSAARAKEGNQRRKEQV